MKTVAIILAAGQSQRFGSNKLWVEINGKPIWLNSFEAFAGSKMIDAVGVVCPPEMEDDFRNLVPGALFVVAGGASRQESCLRGLLAVPDEFEFVLVHDAARPFVSSDLIDRVANATRESGAAFPGIPVTDTIKQKVDRGWATPPRSELFAVQTPQGARRDQLLAALQRAEKEYTDESSLLESQGISVTMVEGDVANKKVTHRGDESSNIKQSEMRVGFGFDIHRFSSDPLRPLWLGGLEFDHRPGLEGHSDADVLIHAIVDALLGAASLGDIGLLYPNTDPRWKDAPSAQFLGETAQRLTDLNWKIVNIDATVIAEEPKIMPRKDEIISKLADIVGIERERISIKATTNEKLGSIGRSEGISAHAVATIVKV